MISSMLSITIPALSVAGAVLVVRGLRGTRAGTGPRCRRCGRELTAVPGNHCPHCQMLLLPDAVTLGGRQPHRRALAAGVLLLAVSLIGLTLLLTRLFA